MLSLFFFIASCACAATVTVVTTNDTIAPIHSLLMLFAIGEGGDEEVREPSGRASSSRVRFVTHLSLSFFAFVVYL
jgi:hypothetical protein